MRKHTRARAHTHMYILGTISRVHVKEITNIHDFRTTTFIDTSFPPDIA